MEEWVLAQHRSHADHFLLGNLAQHHELDVVVEVLHLRPYLILLAGWQAMEGLVEKRPVVSLYVAIGFEVKL